MYRPTNSDCLLAYLKSGKTYSFVIFHGKLLHTLNAAHNPRKRMKYLRGRVPYYSNSSASFNIELLRAGDIESNPGDVSNPCSVCNKTIARTHRALRCSTCCLYSHIKCGDVTPVAYRETIAMSNYYWVCRSCIIRSAMPFSDVEDVDFLQLFQDGEGSINNQDGGCQNRNMANDSNPASWYKENIRSRYKFNLTIAHLNNNASVNKVDEVKSILDECSFDILFLAETKLNSTIGNLLLDHPNYRILRKGRSRNGGGIMAYVRSNITVIRRRKLEPANIKSLSLDVRGNNGVYFMICACYRSPGKCKPTVFLSSMAATLELMFNLRREIVVIGDLNFDLCSDHNDVKKFKEL